MFFPMLTIEWPDLNASYRSGLKAPYIDTVTVGMGTRHIKRLDAASLTEEVFGNSGVERVTRECLLAANEPETVFRHDQMQKAALATDRAVAFDGFDIGGCLNLELHAAAVTPASMSNRWACFYARLGHYEFAARNTARQHAAEASIVAAPYAASISLLYLPLRAALFIFAR